jgi:5'-nucleotidase
MTTDLSDTLVIGISATALFDLREADAVFREHFETDRARSNESQSREERLCS